MIGRTDFHQIFPPKAPRPEGTPVLDVQNLSIKNLLKDISFSLRKGEILGFAGLVGSGRTELAEALMGIRSIQLRTISLAGKGAVTIKKPADAVQYGLGYLSCRSFPEDGPALSFRGESAEGLSFPLGGYGSLHPYA